jgi:hypothetical protein
VSGSETIEPECVSKELQFASHLWYSDKEII